MLIKRTFFVLLFAVFCGMLASGQTPIASVSVHTDINVPGPTGPGIGYVYSFMRSNWDKNELYVRNLTSIVVIDTQTWMIKKSSP